MPDYTVKTEGFILGTSALFNQPRGYRSLLADLRSQAA